MSLLSLKSVFDLFITLERRKTFLEIIKSVVSSPFVKAEADTDRIVSFFLHYLD